MLRRKGPDRVHAGAPVPVPGGGEQCRQPTHRRHGLGPQVVPHSHPIESGSKICRHRFFSKPS